MKGFRKALAVLLCLLLSCALAACGRLTYSVQVSAGGARTMILRVYYEDMTDADKAYVKTFLEDVSHSRNASGRHTEVTVGEGYVALREEYDSATDYYIAMGYTGDEPNDERTPTEDINAYFFRYVTEMSLVSRATLMSYAFQYAVGDYAAKGEGNLLQLWHSYVAGFNALPTSPLYSVYSELSEVELDRLLPATVQAMDGDKGDLVATDLATWLAAKGYNVDDVSFAYTYEHVYKSVKGAEPTKTYTNSETGATVYRWDMTLADVPDATITLYQTVPRAWAWELTAVAIGFVTIGVILTIILIRRRKNQHAGEREE